MAYNKLCFKLPNFFGETFYVMAAGEERGQFCVLFNEINFHFKFKMILRNAH